jgi:hypothetical protein
LQRIARHCASYTSTLRQSLVVEHGDKLSRGSKRTLDPERNVGDHMRLHLKLTIAEQLEENSLGQFNVGRVKAYNRRQSKSRQKVRSAESPGVWRCSAGQQEPGVVLHRGVYQVKKKRLCARCLVGVIDQERVGAGAGIEALFVPPFPGDPDGGGGARPDRSEMAFSRAFRSDEHQHSTGPVRPKLDCFQRVEVGRRREKIFAREAWRMRPAKCQLPRRRHHWLSGSELPR